MTYPSEGKLRGRAWRVLKAKFRKRCETVNAACWLCDQAIDYQAKWTQPNAFEADHAKPVSTHPDLALMMGNLRPSHRSCNRSRGNKAAPGSWARADW